MVRNTDTLASPGGSYGPWLELYNRRPCPVDLGGVGVAFDDNPATWRLAAPAELAPGAYVAIRADELVGPGEETAWTEGVARSRCTSAA